MAKFSILGRFVAENIPSVVPPDYRGLVRIHVVPGANYTVVLFAHDRREVVTSAAVRRALARIPVAESVLAVGANFTVEATELLQERKAGIARIGEFQWTDEQYQNVLR